MIKCANEFGTHTALKDTAERVNVGNTPEAAPCRRCYLTCSSQRSSRSQARSEADSPGTHTTPGPLCVVRLGKAVF